MNTSTNSDGLTRDIFCIAGYGSTWQGGTAGTSPQSEILADEVEFIWKILPLGQRNILQHLPDLYYVLFISSYDSTKLGH